MGAQIIRLARGRTPFPFPQRKRKPRRMGGESHEKGADTRQRILLVTGMLGAGKTTALRELEDRCRLYQILFKRNRI